MVCKHIWKVIHQNNLEKYLPEKSDDIEIMKK